MADVVVLPCAPATQIERRDATISASSWARWRRGRPSSRAASSSGSSAAIADETTTSIPGLEVHGVMPDRDGHAEAREALEYTDGARSQPVTSAPQA